jgi:ribulose kinase
VKENLEESWALASHWMDLSDWLTFRYMKPYRHQRENCV